MLFTRDFIFIHMPKNVGSFVEEVLRKIYGRQDTTEKLYRKFAAPMIAKIENREPHCFRAVPFQLIMRGYAEALIHGHCYSLPEKYAHRKLLAVLRDPLDRYISEYEFRWWSFSGRKHPQHDKIIAEYPHWPHEHSFSEEIEIRHRFHTQWQMNLCPSDRVGIQTEHFIRFFCREPRALLAKGGKLTLKEVCNALYPVHFLNMENVNSELASFLKIQGCSQQQCAIAEEHQKVLPAGRGRAKHGDIDDYFTAEMRERVENRETLLTNIWKAVRKGDHTAEALQTRFA
mgnify:CR=1 FL=1